LSKGAQRVKKPSSARQMFKAGFTVGIVFSMLSAFQNCAGPSTKLEQSSSASKSPNCQLRAAVQTQTLNPTAATEKYSAAIAILDKEATGDSRFEALANYVNAAINAERFEEAERSAKDILHEAHAVKPAVDGGYALHEAHSLLGLLALKKGNFALAKEHFRQAAQVPTSPRLRALGPNMSLAKALLEKGDCDDVLDYLQSISKLWNDDLAKKSSSEWMSNIASGQMPDFKGNLGTVPISWDSHHGHLAGTVRFE
jgi:tetratricopeptide (TPR) repeat protein